MYAFDYQRPSSRADATAAAKGNARWIRRASAKFQIDELHWGDAATSGPARIHLTPALH